MTSRKRATAAALAAGLVLATTATAAQPAGQSATRASAKTPTAVTARSYHHFRGRVTYRNDTHRWFRMRTTSNRSLRIHTNQRTYWDDCDWGQMSYGHHVDVRAYRSHGMWVASRMQNWDDWDGSDHMDDGW